MTDATSHDSGQFRFVSLHKKWLLSLGLLLLILSAIFGVLNHRYLNELVKAQRQASKIAWRLEFKGLIDHSVDRLQRLSVVLASLGKLAEHLDRPGTSFDTAQFERQFSSVRYELDVDRIMLFDKQGVIRWNWATNDRSSDVSMQPMLDAIARVKNTEQPEAALDCQAQCGLNIVMPLLKDGQNVGYIGLTQRITDLVVEFSTATGVDIGLLTHAKHGGATTFPRWRLYSSALTHASTLKPLMASLSERYASPADIPDDVELLWNGEFYLFDVLPLDDIVKGSPQGYLVFISNVTKATRSLNYSVQNSLLLMAMSLLFAEIFLFLFLRRPLWRLERLAATLPLVAQGNYQDAYAQYDRQKQSDNCDEIDMLYQSSYQLTRQIEEQQLALASDRDFIQGILDSVQVMILTQTYDGKIHTVNRYMAQLLGRPGEQLRGRRFMDVIEDGKGKEYYRNNRLNLLSSSLPRLEHEGSIVDANGEQRHIIWIHTYIGQSHHDEIALLSVGMDATDRILAENRSRWLAYHDPLTGLANRLRFYEELERSLADSLRNDATYCVLLLDLDHFKTVNDTSGHAAGDSLLVILANELRTRVRRSDLVARLGGDEFAVLMPNTGRAGAEAFAQSLNERLGQRKFQFGNQEYQITASIGIALMPLHGRNIEELMINADAAMYMAKKAGRGRHHVFTPDAQLVKPGVG